MKYNSGFKAIAAGLMLGATLTATSVMANEIDYSATPGSYINFDGSSHFSFSPSAGSFVINGGTASGFTGEMTGVFTIGTVSGNEAPVSGSGTFTIEDGLTPLTATLTWGDIFAAGTAGDLNLEGTINLSHINYAGSNPDLVTLLGSGAGIDVLSFTFIPGKSVSQLKTTVASTGFSGSVNPVVPDGGTTIALMGGALLVIGGIRRKISR